MENWALAAQHLGVGAVPDESACRSNGRRIAVPARGKQAFKARRDLSDWLSCL